MTSQAELISRRGAALSLALGATVLGGLAIAAPDAQAAVTRATVAGPSADLAINSNDQVDVAVAPDGSAALAFSQKVGGVDHAFVSRYVSGNWSVPVRVDLGLATPSAKPSVAVANGGRTVVVFPNGTAGNERLYAAIAPDAISAFQPKLDLQLDPAGWKNVDLDLAPGGNGYFTVHQGFQVRAWRVQGSTFTQVGGDFPSAAGVLNAVPAEQVEAGDQRGAHIAVDATGATAVTAWTETSGVGDYKPFARKLSGTAPAQVGPAVDASIDTFGGKTAVKSFNDMSSVAVGGDGRAWVAFRAGFDYGGSNKGRALVRSFDGTTFGTPQQIDGLPADPAESAEFPEITANASGAGLAASYRQLTFGTEAATLAAGGSWTTATGVSEGTNLTAGRASVGLADSGVGLVSMFSEVTAGQGRVLGRISGGPAAGTLETLSDPAFGAASAAVETGAGGGYAITAFRQGSAATTRIVAAVVPLPAPVAPTTPATSGAGETPGTGQPAAVAPTLTGLRLKTKQLTATGAAPKLVAATAKKRTLRFTLDRSATVELRVVKVRTGKLAGGRCTPAKGKRVPRKQRCALETPVKGTATLQAPAGTSHVHFGGRVTKGRSLAPGSYALYATARDGQAAATPVRAAFSLRAR